MNFAAAALYAVSTSVLLATLLALINGGLRPHLAMCALALGMLVGALGVRPRFRWRNLSPCGWGALVVFALFSLRSFLWLIFYDGDAIKVLSPNNLGDLSLHLTYIRQLANGVPFWPDNPIYAGGKLTYPVGMDLFNAVLALIGVDVHRGLIWVGLGGCALAATALWRWGGAFAVAGFLANGGTLGWVFLRTGEFSDYQADAAWKSLPLALFVTQRGLLFALPAGLLLLASWRARFFGAAEDERLPIWGEVLLYASLPIFHLHTFLFLSVLLAVWFVSESSARLAVARLVALAVVPASVLVFLVTDGFKSASMLGWKPGWMQEEQNFFVFWFSNFGILPLLLGALVFRLMWDQEARWPRAIVFPAVAVFIVCCFVKFAPWEWDNTKLMLWCYLAVLPVLWTHLLARWHVEVRAFTCVLLFFSGFVSLFGGLGRKHQGYEIATRSELDGFASAARTIPTGERFAGWPTYNHPLLLLGRPMALGYPGHVWSHGLALDKPAAQVEDLLNGGVNWQKQRDALGVRYVFWGSRERENYPNSRQPWRKQPALVAAGAWGEIYDLKDAGAPP